MLKYKVKAWRKGPKVTGYKMSGYGCIVRVDGTDYETQYDPWLEYGSSASNCKYLNKISTAITTNDNTDTYAWHFDSDAATDTSILCKYNKHTIRWIRQLQNAGFYKADWEEVIQKATPPSERLRQIIQTRHAPRIVTTRKSLNPATDFREQCARETLRRVLGESLFRDFLKRGFISITAKSGLTYQIFPGHGFTQVYNQGVLVDRLCVVLQGDFPPTDSIIMRYILILNDESEFRKLAVKHAVSTPIPQFKPALDLRTLPEIMRDLRKAA